MGKQFTATDNSYLLGNPCSCTDDVICFQSRLRALKDLWLNICESHVLEMLNYPTTISKYIADCSM